MKAYLYYLWDRARNSFWFVPLVLSLGAVLLSVVLPHLDRLIQDRQLSLPEWTTDTTAAARSLLTLMASTVVTVMATVFSITIVALSLASQQLGPRLLRRFMHDLVTQVAMGVFIATSLYCLLVLRQLEGGDSDSSALPVSLFVAVILTVLSLALLVTFIHHVAVLIQASEVVASVAGDLDDALVEVFPENIGEPLANTGDGDRDLSTDYLPVHSTKEGYVQAISGDRLLGLASDHDLIIRVLLKPGDFMTREEPLVHVWAVSALRTNLDTDAVSRAVNDAFLVGNRRNPLQDFEAAVLELAEVAVRSLSPGINDPFTAMICIDHLGANLGRLAARDLPAPHRADKNGRLRLITRRIQFEQVLNIAFDQIRHYGRTSVAVTVRLLETLARISRNVRLPEDREAVRHQIEMVGRHGDHLVEPRDKEKVKQLADQVLDELMAAARFDPAPSR